MKRSAGRNGLRVPAMCGRKHPQVTLADQTAASLSFLSGRTFSLVVAGLAANQTSSLVKGLMPLRLGFAGTLVAVILRTPGSVKLPAPFFEIDPCMAPSSAASTARTSLAGTSLTSAICAIRPDFVSVSLIGFGLVPLPALFF